MAGIRKRGDGGWEIRWYAGKQRRSKTFHGTLREAKVQMALLEAADAGRSKAGPVSMADAMAVWLEEGGNRTSPNSYRAVESRTRNWVAPRLGHLPVDKITHRTLEAFYRDLSKHLSYDSIQNIRWDISGALRYALREGHITKNPAELVKFDRWEEVPEIEPPTVEMIAALLAWTDAKDRRPWAELGLAVRLAVATGARRGEICGFRWGDIDHDRSSIRIERNVISLKDAAVQVRKTKTNVKRVTGLPEPVIRRLDAHRARWFVDYPSGPDDPIIMGSEPGRHVNPQTISARFQMAKEGSGVHFRFHDLRHFAVSVWLTEMPLHDVSHAIGHRRISTTADTYGHKLPEAVVDRRFADAISRRIDL